MKFYNLCEIVPDKCLEIPDPMINAFDHLSVLREAHLQWFSEFYWQYCHCLFTWKKIKQNFNVLFVLFHWKIQMNFLNAIIFVFLSIIITIIFPVRKHDTYFDNQNILITNFCHLPYSNQVNLKVNEFISRYQLQEFVLMTWNVQDDSRDLSGT